MYVCMPHSVSHTVHSGRRVTVRAPLVQLAVLGSMFESISWVTRVTPSNTANVIGQLKRSNNRKVISEACNLKSILPSDPALYLQKWHHTGLSLSTGLSFLFSHQ